MRLPVLAPLLLALGLVSGCDMDTGQRSSHLSVHENPSAPNETDRFKVESFGFFKAGHENNRREIVVVRDAETGREYLGITGVGVTELHRKLIQVGSGEHPVHMTVTREE